MIEDDDDYDNNAWNMVKRKKEDRNEKERKMIIHMNTSKVLPTFEVDIGFQKETKNGQTENKTVVEMTPI